MNILLMMIGASLFIAGLINCFSVNTKPKVDWSQKTKDEFYWTAPSIGYYKTKNGQLLFVQMSGAKFPRDLFGIEKNEEPLPINKDNQ